MNELEMKRALNRVKQYVAQKDYAKAKALLSRIEHPKQAQWLAQIDASERQYNEEKRPKPWDPNTIFIVTVTGSPIFSAFIYAWNWRRFGKGNWGWWTVLAQISLLAFLIGGGFLFFTNLPTDGVNDPLRNALLMYPFLLLAGMNYALSFLIGSRQAAAYKLLKEKGHQAMLAFDYQWGRNILLYIGGVFLIMTALTGYFYYDALPKHFEDEHFSLDYPGDWKPQSLSQIEDCDVPMHTCNLYIMESGYGGTELVFHTYESNRNVGTSLEFGKRMWEANIVGDERFTPITAGSLTVAGHDAYFLNYSNRDGYFYKDVLISFGDYYIYVVVAADSAESLEEDWPAVMQILDSMVINQE